ncbi:bifunctional protein tyrosine phosphatase family protein/NAD(P)/FAD-dependent oxidoreductase [Kordiimonas sp. SCSIO 12610]|uniref:bifunctional protein tyrosine phosphatase family protein/NAD(P)/FAD-dependent oxidoreductase n=1 Tax=Kordiimonas sp. SCSIO 12610 TaxID=2829597 RepID=UPI00210D2AD7|nr:bifunctional protein tyrosine phosphatase family protein/NAD(P)/FAD-dependent oxidoreductase [Kordiimonas sp. SCSIO 12610]UTW54645.1 TIGR01244 family phosphatase [Kordiimonas sp. SCSIO 12610]
MDIKTIAPDFSVTEQIQPQDVSIIASQGFRSIIINRPDNESSDQPEYQAFENSCSAAGVNLRFIPVVPGKITDEDVERFRMALQELPAPTLAFCRTGTRSMTLWALAQSGHLSTDAILKAASGAGYDLSALRSKLESKEHHNRPIVPTFEHHDILIIGGGAGGVATASSIVKRRPGSDIAIVEPKNEHYYQPGWTLVGGGVFDREQTERPMASVIPSGVTWIRSACAEFEPDRNQIVLEDGRRISYQVLVVSPGLKLNWEGIEGLKDTLGQNGVTSNYLFDMAPYTWDLISAFKGGRALFTQPAMPIKCAGAPQKAMYLACDHWKRHGVLGNVNVKFHNAGGVLFGVKDYVPSLMKYVDMYGIDLCFNENLIAVDGQTKEATFEVTDAAGEISKIKRGFDMLHVTPPQVPLGFIQNSPLANEAGWIDVDGETLQHTKYGNIFGLGDGGSTPNAKTAAAVRKQAPVVAHNALAVLRGKTPTAVYNGYGSCPLTVERGKIILAEFAYGGKLDPSVPTWMLDGTKPTRRAWFLKEKMLPNIYFDMMLKGTETLAKPKILPHRPVAHQAHDAFRDQIDNRP